MGTGSAYSRQLSINQVYGENDGSGGFFIYFRCAGVEVITRHIAWQALAVNLCKNVTVYIENILIK